MAEPRAASSTLERYHPTRHDQASSLDVSSGGRLLADQSKVEMFREWTTGTLLYAVVMGFFDDYTDVLEVRSFSILFLAAFVMQALTYGTLVLKKRTAAWHRRRSKKPNLVALGLSIWAIMFFSKFVFLEVLDIVFGDTVEVSGFVGLVLIIGSMLIVDALIGFVDRTLSDATEG